MTASTDRQVFYDAWYVELFVPADSNPDVELTARIAAELRATCTSLDKTLPEGFTLRVDQ